MKKSLSGLKNFDHYKKGQKIKNGTDRANDQHELANKVNIPLSGAYQVFFVDIVQWDRNFGYGDAMALRSFIIQR